MKKSVLSLSLIAMLAACSKDDDPVFIPPASEGSEMTLEGNNTELSGSAAGNSVFVDFSNDKQTPIERKSWDLGFYTGDDSKVILNNTTVAYATVINKTDLNATNSSDTAGIKLHFDQNGPTPNDFAKMDDLSGDLAKTLIPVGNSEAEAKVVIINPGTGALSANPTNPITRDYYKVKIIKSSNGYTLQYAKLTATTFQTIEIAKTDSKNEFAYFSLEKGQKVTGFPAKEDWDIKWGYAAYSFSGLMYPFSDLVEINHLNGVQAFEREYASEEVAADAYTKFNKDSVSKYTFSDDRWIIGDHWRKTTGTVGVLKDRFYIVKDPSNNIYKLKFVSFTTQDGGERGRPQIKYDLIK